MDEHKLLVSVAVLAVAVSLVGAFFTYYNAATFQSWMTGYATSQSNASINITIDTAVAINFTNSNINFGSGSVNQNALAAVIDTSAGTAQNGTWVLSANAYNLTLRNIGNINVSLDIRGLNNATTFIGGSGGGGPLYRINLSNMEPGACSNASGGTMINGGTYNLSTWLDLNQSNQRICGNFSFLDTKDDVRIDLYLRIPYDSLTSARSDTIIVTATESSGAGG